MKRLVGPDHGPRAGGDLKGKPRKITALAPDNSLVPGVRAGGTPRSCRAAGQDFDVEPIAYRLDLTSRCRTRPPT